MKPGQLDGRHKRSQDSRARIVEAMLEITRETWAPPKAEAVADRAGVGLRSVFRHFRDMESLYTEASEVIEVELRGIAARPFHGATWRERVVEMIRRRGQAFETAAPYRRASDMLRGGSPAIQSDHERMTQVLRMLLVAQLPQEVAAEPVLLDSLDLMLSFEAWLRLRQEQSLSEDETVAVLEHAVRRLIGSD